MKDIIQLAFVVILLSGCKSKKNSIQDIDYNLTRDTVTTQTTLPNLSEQNNLIDGITMPLRGMAYNRKGGAVVVSNSETYWIDGLDSWDISVNKKEILVWGDVVLRNDNPVFLDTGNVVTQGIPVETQEELEAQRDRLWILNVKYELVKP